jgi:tetratricopeptide (TPR) repeat protein
MDLQLNSMSRHPKKAKNHGEPPSAPAALTPSKRKLFRWVAALGLPLLFLFLLEIALRLCGFGYPTAFFVPAQTGPPGTFAENPKFGWRFFPRRLARAPDSIRLSRTKAPGTYRIFVFGESAALGDPEQAYGFSRILEELLQARFPGTRFEVINVAMTAISSHVILRIARDCVPFQGDLWIFYMGNNEVVGPFGAGSVFGAKVPPRLLIKASLALKSTRLGQLVDLWAQKVSARSQETQHWEGMKMMLNEQVRANDPALQRVYSNFGHNLDDMLTIAEQAGVKAIVCSVSCNLKDCAPFASLNRMDLTANANGEWQRQVEAGVEAQSRNEFGAALAKYGLAADIDKSFAALAFRTAQCYLAQGDGARAREYYLRARDLDALRFRADTAINGIVRAVCARHADAAVRFLDSETALTNACKLGIPGEECFWDHVHFNFDGNYRVASALAEQAAALLPPQVRAMTPADARPLTEGECAERLAFTDWDRRAVLEEMWRRVHDAPFTGQIDHEQLLSRWLAQRAELDRKLDRGALAEATQTYLTALTHRPDDWRLHHRFGFLLEKTGDLAGAEQQWKRVAELVPDYIDAWFKLGDISARESKPDQAAAYYREVLRFRPTSPEAMNGLGLVLASQGQTDDAVHWFREALRADPHFAQAQVNWGLLLARRGQADQAEAHYRAALGSDPNSGGGHINLANLLTEQKRYPEAIEQYSMAIGLQPGDATIHLALANALEAAGRDSEALAQYRECIRLQPTLAEAHFNCGVALAKKGDLEGATTCFQEAVRLQPNDAQAHLDLGVALGKQSRFSEAIVQFQAVLRLDPGNETAKRFLQMATARAGQSEGRAP